MNKSIHFLVDKIFSHCEYPPRLTDGKSVWAELFIDSEDNLCVQGFENYIPLVKASEITQYRLEDEYMVYIMAEFESCPLVIGFACCDTGIHSLSFKIYGMFSISASSSFEISDYLENGKLHDTFTHIDPDKQEDCETAINILASWRKQPTDVLLSKVGKRPQITEQVLELIDAWEEKASISKRKCFQEIGKLMAENGIKSFEDAVDIDIAECYVNWFNEYKNE